MPNTTTPYRDPSTEKSSTVGERLSDTAAQVKEKASNLGRTAADTIDENRDAAASGLDKAASTLHETAERLPGGEKVTGLAHSAADKLSSTADYVRASFRLPAGLARSRPFIALAARSASCLVSKPR